MRSTILTTATTYSTTSYLTTQHNTVASVHVQTSSLFSSKPSLKIISIPITHRTQSKIEHAQTTSIIATYYSPSSTISYPTLNLTKQNMKPEVISGWKYILYIFNYFTKNNYSNFRFGHFGSLGFLCCVHPDCCCWNVNNLIPIIFLYVIEFIIFRILLRRKRIANQVMEMEQASASSWVFA